ncbi:phage tail protein [Mesorhizobium sp. M1273]|uniref:phage tail protein n=1 Tax=Mesorhizobium sp. M1273 TaxID=2957075 RepID=UPI003335C048
MQPLPSGGGVFFSLKFAAERLMVNVQQRQLGSYQFTSTRPPSKREDARRTGLVTPIALGRPKPAVVGTGKVDGIPVYGLTKAVRTSYSYTSYADQYWDHNNAPLPEPTTAVTISVGYLLCKDYFRRGYKLIRLEANGEVQFDAENGSIPKCAFRFYNGLQTAVDPIATEVVGPNAGAHTGDVLIFLEDFPASSAPTITCVISNAATETGGTEELAWTGTAPTDMDQSYIGACYDPVEGVIYQVLTSDEISGLGICYLSVLDVDSHVERYRVPLAGSEPYAGGGFFNNGVWTNAIRGSGYVVVRFATEAEPVAPTRVYNAVTGEIVAEWQEAADESILWLAGEAFGDKWLLVGGDADASGGQVSVFAVIDIAAGSFTVTRGSLGYGTFVSTGRVSSSSASFFLGSFPAVYEVIYDGDTWSAALAYTSFGIMTAIQYDPLTEYLVVLEDYPSGTFNVQLVAPDTGFLADAFTVSQPFFQLSQFTMTERSFPRPGFLMVRSNSQELWIIDIGNKTATMLADFEDETGQETRVGFFDHARLSYFSSRGDTVWTEYTIPGTTPGQITLESHISDILIYLGPYTIDQIEFLGFDGLVDWGDVIDKDGTNIRSLLRSYQDPLGFVWTDSGSKIVFRKTPTDGSFTADQVVADSDLVFKKGGSINSDDASDIARVTKVSLEYNSKDDNYQPRTVTADSFSALYEVTRSTKESQFSTSLILSDVDGERLVNELLWKIQPRTHSFSAYGEFAKMIPGDVISIASGDVSYTVEIAKVNIKENMVVEFDARDFQTSLSADVAAVTNTGFSGTSTASVQSQYIHLDIPLLRYSDDAGGAWLVQYGVVASRGQANWGGGSLYSGDTANELSIEYDQAAHGGVIGVCVDVLANPLDPFSTTDDSTVTIRKISGDATLLADRTEDEVLAGQNLAFVGSAGRWEGVGYRTVTNNGDGSYTLSGFTVRGYRGTEVFAPLHQAGDLFVMVGAAWIEPVVHPAADLNRTKFYKAVGFGQSPAASVAASHLLRGAAETPYAPVNLAAAFGVPDGLDLSWDYRSRLAAGTNPANFGEAVLSFEIDIMDGSTIKRTLTSATGSVHYSAANITADFGSVPDFLLFRVYMISAAVGRGYQAQRYVPLNYEPTFDSSVLTFDATEITFDQEP